MTFLKKNTKTSAKANKVENFEVASFLPTSTIVLYSVWLEIIGLHLVYVNIYYFPPVILFRLYLFLKLKRTIVFFLLRILMNLRKVKVIFFCQEPFIKFLALCGTIHSFFTRGNLGNKYV